MATRVRAHTYRGTTGFSITGSPADSKGFPVSIFVRCRSTAVRIRKILNTPLANTRTAWDTAHKKIDLLIHADSRVKVCRR